jgi:hypothetical protein
MPPATSRYGTRDRASDSSQANAIKLAKPTIACSVCIAANCRAAPADGKAGRAAASVLRNSASD